MSTPAAVVSNPPAPTAATTNAWPKWTLWVGRVLSALPVLMLVGSSFATMTGKMNDVVVGHLGYPESAVVGLGITELCVALIYAIPQTAVLGAVLMTAWLGGAVATHVHAGEGFGMAIIVGIVVWVGLYLREPRLRALAPLRKM